MLHYYEIARFANQWPEMEEFNEVDRMVRRGYVRKAIRYMSDWDYGGENLSAAIALGNLRDEVLDTKSTSDRIVKQLDGYWLCESRCPSGLYEAYYLVRAVDESDLS